MMSDNMFTLFDRHFLVITETCSIVSVLSLCYV